MIGSFLTRGLVMVFGYAYPAYECFKTVEMNKPDVEHLRFWCQYWILVAVLTVCERIGDAFISWVPMYSEAKLAFYIYLWYPKTKGTTYVYDSFFRPYVAKHEPEIDRNLLELRTRAGDMVVLYWQRAASYGQTRIFDILQFVAAQSTPRPRHAQPKQVVATAHQPSTTNRKPSTETQPQTQELPFSPTSSSSSSGQHQQEEEVAEEERAPKLAAPPSPAPPPPVTKDSSTTRPVLTLAEAMQIDSASSSLEIQKANSLPEESIIEETPRVTRGRLRKGRSVPSS